MSVFIILPAMAISIYLSFKLSSYSEILIWRYVYSKHGRGIENKNNNCSTKMIIVIAITILLAAVGLSVISDTTEGLEMGPMTKLIIALIVYLWYFDKLYNIYKNSLNEHGKEEPTPYLVGMFIALLVVFGLFHTFLFLVEKL